MDTYLFIVILSIAAYVLVGMFAGRKVASTADYYVSGRNAPTVLIAGTLFASMVSTNSFMGDCGWAYSGNFANELYLSGICAMGFVFGVVLFGRFLRRSEALTMPEYFKRRFNDSRMQRLGGIVVVISLICYLLAVTTGVGTLLNAMLGWPSWVCYIVAYACFMSFTLYAGSKGVIITDTMMFLIFLFGSLIAGPYMWSHTDGLTGLFRILVEKANELPQGFLDYHGNFAGAMATNAFGAVLYGIIYGVIWFIVVGISPWQAGRFLMAKSEHVALRASTIACACEVIFCTYLFFESLTVNALEAAPLAASETVMIYACYHYVPKIIGAVVLAGIMAAGLSSASTFLSVSGFSLVNDVLQLKFKDDKDQLRKTRIIMILIGLTALGLSFFGLGGVRIVTWFASTIVAASWVVTCFGGVWSKKLTAQGARWSMVTGFVTFFVCKALQATGAVTIFTNFLDPFLMAVYLSIAAAVLGSREQKPSPEETEFLEKLHVLPESLKKMSEYRRDYVYCYILIGLGIVWTCVLLFIWALPYNGII